MPDKSNTDLARQERPAGVTEWEGAAQRGLLARRERESIIEQVLIAGVDFGVIPGTEKNTLLKPGAEKIADCLNLCPDYEAIESQADWDRGRFFYRYRCSLRPRGSDAVVATGLGSCNSMEARYRWRNAERACPECKKPAIIKGSEKYGGGFLCWKKKGGCGAKFKDDDQRITGQVAGKIENDDPFSLVNTIDKMAQKRALVAATLNLGFSHKFTQDLEDDPSEDPDIPETVKPTEPPKGKPDDPISEKDRRRIFAKWKERAEEIKLPAAETEKRLKALILRYGYDSTTKICQGDLTTILEAIESYEVPDAA